MTLATCAGGILPPHDELVAFPFGLEKSAARRLIKSGELPARRLGRRWYAKRSDVLALIDAAPPPPVKPAGSSPADDLIAIADRVRGGR